MIKVKKRKEKKRKENGCGGLDELWDYWLEGHPEDVDVQGE
jgi:hypothetical protein